MTRVMQALLGISMAFGTSVAVALDDVSIVVPDMGDTVNANGFTIVAKASGDFSGCSEYAVHARIRDTYNGYSWDETAYVNGLNTWDSARLKIIEPSTVILMGHHIGP